MAHIKFQHVFASLLVLSALSAFIVGRSITDASRAAVQGIFAPVARPTHLLAGWIAARVHGPRADDNGPGGSARSSEQILKENQELRVALANLSGQLSELRHLDAQMATIANVREQCVLARVIGGDAGNRQSIGVSTTSLSGLQKGQPVLSFGQNIVGRVDRVSVGGAQVRLITDKDFALTCSFGRFVRGPNDALEFATISTPTALAVGTGKGTMIVESLSMKETQDTGLKENDWVVLKDPEWPLALQGYKLGRVTAIAPQARSPLHAEITIEPYGNLMALREVMVMVK